MALFEACALSCHRGGRLVFAGLDFALERSDALVLRGPNGSGKSTLLRLLALLTPKKSGELLWHGTALVPDEHRARTRFLGHADALKPALSVFENLLFGARIANPETSEAHCLAALERLQLRALALQPARFLSAGQKRRLALARTIASGGALWLLDEPATGLDAQAVTDLSNALAEFRAQGGIVVLSTHGEFALPDAGVLTMETFAAELAA
ncbi:MAG: ABC-type transport system involved in cytochrome c biosis, ATPase component [Alphaproteobacteria bacterium]|jgi:heme exporter protein A|nr:ABC-type transport system involved in cytochrome c biosis, ATPase component [Alphaproteobacteria bacterium]